MTARRAWAAHLGGTKKRVSPKRQAVEPREGGPLQQQLWYHALVLELPLPVMEYCFAPPRRWRFDLAWLDQRLAVEIDGGVWTQGRHTRGSGVVKDCEKFAHAAIHGWRVMRVVPQQVKNGQAIRWIEAALTGRAQEPSV